MSDNRPSFEEILAVWKKAYLDEVPSEVTHESVTHALKRILDKAQTADFELVGRGIVEGYPTDDVYTDGPKGIKGYRDQNSRNASLVAEEVFTLAESKGITIDWQAIDETRRREKRQAEEAYRQRKAAKRRWWWPWSKGG